MSELKKHTDLKIRFAKENDIGLIFHFVKELASYENLLHEVHASEESLREVIFERKIAEVVICEHENRPVGFALFYYSFSTFKGRTAIYIEDLFVIPNMRGFGIGSVMLSYLAGLAKQRDCWGLEWSCLDWNEASIRFYKSLGAISRDVWTTYRLQGEELEKLAARFETPFL